MIAVYVQFMNYDKLSYSFILCETHRNLLLRRQREQLSAQLRELSLSMNHMVLHLENLYFLL